MEDTPATCGTENSNKTINVDTMTEHERQTLADAFDLEKDPLAIHAKKFEQVAINVFELFIEEVLKPQDPVPKTITGYRRTIREWSEFMDEQGRHPACPNENHVKWFLRREIDEKGNSRGTAKKKLWELNKIYSYWQQSAEFPHTVDYNPFLIAKMKLSLSTERVKEPPRITVEELREILSEVKHVRDRAFIITQLKLGLRASEMANIKIREVNIAKREIERHYEDMGTSHHVSQFENAVYIPHDRQGNKSMRPRVLPVDNELRRLWIKYLLVRPDNEEPWLFLSKTNHAKIDDETVNDVWKRNFHPKFGETPRFRAVTSHYGRHRFTTYWRIEQDLNRELIKYMRGDTSTGEDGYSAGGMDYYIHSYYEDIEPLYRERIYKFEV